MDDGRPAILLSEEMAAWRCNRGYAKDMALAVTLAVTDERAAGRVYNVGEPGASTERAWIERIGAGVGWTGRVVTIPGARLPEKLRDDMDTSQALFADTAAIRSDLGYAEFVAPEEALRRTIAWERAHPPEPVNPENFDYAAEDAALADYDPSRQP
jgi:nucleoside-diphosphate-sugar epimerase